MELDSLDEHNEGDGNKLEGLGHCEVVEHQKMLPKEFAVSILGDIQKLIERVLEKFNIIRPQTFISKEGVTMYPLDIPFNVYLLVWLLTLWGNIAATFHGNIELQSNPGWKGPRELIHLCEMESR